MKIVKEKVAGHSMEPVFQKIVDAYWDKFGAPPFSIFSENKTTPWAIAEAMQEAFLKGRAATEADLDAILRRKQAKGMIAVGDRLPDSTFKIMGENGPRDCQVSEIFAGKQAILFGLPGAFTPSCHYIHLPGFVDEYETFKANGIDVVACTAVNDIFVLHEWAKATRANPNIVFLADGNASFATAIGLLLEENVLKLGLGIRSKRYTMLLVNQTVKELYLEPDPLLVEISAAQTMLKAFDDVFWAHNS